MAIIDQSSRFQASGVLERQDYERDRKRSFWSRLKPYRDAKPPANLPSLKVLPATPEKPAIDSSRAQHHSSVLTSIGRQKGPPGVLSSTVFTHTPSTLSLSMPPSMGMAFTRSCSSAESDGSGSRSPSSIRSTFNSASLREIRKFAGKLGLDNVQPRSASQQASWNARNPSAKQRPGITPIVRGFEEHRARQESTLSAGSGPGLSYGPSTASSASLRSADWPTSASTLCTAGSDHVQTSQVHDGKVGEVLQAKSPMMVAVPSSSGRSVTADFGLSLGVGTYGSMVMMDGHDPGYLGQTGEDAEGEDEFARAIEVRLKEIMGMSD